MLLFFSIHSCSVPTICHIFKTLKILLTLKTYKNYTSQSVFTDRIIFENYHTLLHMYSEPLHYSMGKIWGKLTDINPFRATHCYSSIWLRASILLYITTVVKFVYKHCFLLGCDAMYSGLEEPASCIFWVNTDGADSRLLQNMSSYLPDYMVSHLRRLLWDHWHVDSLIRQFYS